MMLTWIKIKVLVKFYWWLYKELSIMLVASFFVEFIQPYIIAEMHPQGIK